LGAATSPDTATEPTEPATLPASPTDEQQIASLLPFDGADDDRTAIVAGDRVLLVIAHDAELASDALAAARSRSFRCLIARRAPLGLALAREYRPEAVLIFSADGRGEVLLSQLKQHPETRHRPVFVAGPSGGRMSALRAGAAGYLEGARGAEAVNHVTQALDDFNARAVRHLALIEDGSGLDPATMTLLGAGEDVDVVKMSFDNALERLRGESADCVVLPVSDGGEAAFALLEAVAADDVLRELPIVVYTADPLEGGERARLDQLTAAVNATTVSTPERLVDETALHLHRMEARLPAATRKLLSQLRTADSVFHGKRILIVDDDIRNVFALTSALEMRGMKVVYAENGREGVTKLRETSDVDLVLLDVMMPEMDGYETARAIRGMSRFDALPIISLTAKAMKGDRDKCIAAGASDYITKPVDVDQLLSLMRVWLHR
jgi:CheY-like chemotaxis protein